MALFSRSLAPLADLAAFYSACRSPRRLTGPRRSFGPSAACCFSDATSMVIPALPPSYVDSFTLEDLVPRYSVSISPRGLLDLHRPPCFLLPCGLQLSPSQLPYPFTTRAWTSYPGPQSLLVSDIFSISTDECISAERCGQRYDLRGREAQGELASRPPGLGSTRRASDAASTVGRCGVSRRRGLRGQEEQGEPGGAQWPGSCGVAAWRGEAGRATERPTVEVRGIEMHFCDCDEMIVGLKDCVSEMCDYFIERCIHVRY
jgi:hypothetical protein